MKSEAPARHNPCSAIRGAARIAPALSSPAARPFFYLSLVNKDQGTGETHIIFASDPLAPFRRFAAHR